MADYRENYSDTLETNVGNLRAGLVDCFWRRGYGDKRTQKLISRYSQNFVDTFFSKYEADIWLRDTHTTYDAFTEAFMNEIQERDELHLDMFRLKNKSIPLSWELTESYYAVSEDPRDTEYDNVFQDLLYDLRPTYEIDAQKINDTAYELVHLFVSRELWQLNQRFTRNAKYPYPQSPDYQD